MKHEAEAPEELAKLVLDDEVNPPPPLNRHIASLSLRMQSNRIDDGYDISASVVIGADDLTLVIGDTTLSIKVDIHMCEVDMKFVRTRVDFGSGYSYFEEASRAAEKESIKRSTARSHDLGGAIDLSNRVAANLGLKSSMKSETNSALETQKTKYPFHHIAIDCLSIGEIGSKEPLFGNVVQDYVGWRAKPKTLNDKSGALARLRFKRNWIRMHDPRVQSGLSAIARRLKDLFAGKSEEEKLKAAAFPVLLEKLVHMRLQEPDEQDYATIAAAVVAVRPVEADQEVLLSPRARPPIEIDLTIVEDFLDTPGPKIIQFLNETERGYRDKDEALAHSNGSAVRSGEKTGRDSSPLPHDLLELLQENPDDLSKQLKFAVRNLLNNDAPIPVARFEDVRSVHMLEGLGLLVVSEDFVTGVDAAADDNPAAILAERMLDIPSIRSVFDAFTLLPSSGYKRKNSSSKLLEIGPAVGTSLFAALSNSDHFDEISSGDEGAIERSLWAWCEFIREELNK